MHIVEERSEVMTKGYARYDLADQLGVADADPRLSSLVAEFSELPTDPYARSAGRFRRYSRGVITPWDNGFSWIPPVLSDDEQWVTEYYQGDHNPEFTGARRQFPALRESATDNPLLRDLILFDFGQTEWSPVDLMAPIHVGVHMINLVVDEAGQEAVASPNCLHQDGEPYTFAHLMYRDNVVGGGNTIAPPRCAGMTPGEISEDLVMAEFELTKPLESYGVRDDKVSHYVAPIRRGGDPRPGGRAILLVDFTPMAPRI
ncbi:2OG-Fe dioxygenase family protein [Nocardiopsis sp. EMB25]|uniref:2OG-Fe dioxygenase family protein n=1 Tax=Nocardiopsis TaxID=2013 RepID=UPI000366B1C6|nr:MULTISPECIES: 2OG-Fe dioxygenase family protein [Nocardiopsis]MCY9786126.1 2OG-Fe dioxygenase family protein [Nocardiopsis sp. EMB25]